MIVLAIEKEKKKIQYHRWEKALVFNDILAGVKYERILI